MENQRRDFIKKASLLSAAAYLIPVVNALAANGKQPIMLRSAWQTVNIGDIGHTFSTLEFFKFNFQMLK